MTVESIPLSFTTVSADRLPAADRERILADPGFGRSFTDHMVTIRWTADRGWHDAKLGPYGPLLLDPSAHVFHYGQEVFEGLKAYRRPDGTTVVFRPDANAARFNRSCARMAMPELPEETFVEALDLLVAADREWVPEAAGHSLYLRPFIIATQATLAAYGPSSEYLFAVIASPSGPYFPAGVKPITVWLSSDYTRAAPGGTGAAKCGGNYAGAIKAQMSAAEKGCDQVVWLDSAEHRRVEEMGTSNIFFVYGDRLVTPPLTDTMIAGVTRDSLLALARDIGLTTEESPMDVGTWRADAESGALTEAFASGTSAMITPIGTARSEAGSWTMGDGTPGAVTMRLRAELAGVQSGERPDPYGWVRKIG